MYQILPACLWRESKRSDRPQAIGSLVKNNIIPSTTEITANDAKVTALSPESGVLSTQKFFIADTLSRAPEGFNQTAANKKDEFQELTLKIMPVSEVKLEQFKSAMNYLKGHGKRSKLICLNLTNKNLFLWLITTQRSL